ncbi:FAS-associated death domain protein isoform X3 [Chiloscyllium punctatum]|uniref:FAS-associated death domain protein isoform X3 n=1 Tax=Chiloscyllium punctatum TaxID=137246 RepID=UPI003B63ED4F
MEPEGRFAAMRFAALLNNLSQSLSRDNVDSLKFLCREMIGKRRLEAMASGLQLFQQLEELNLLGPDNTDTLSGLLSAIQRHDLQQQLDAFQQRGQEPQADSGNLNVAFDIICNELGNEWRMFARKLGHKEALLQQIEYKHPRNMREQIQQSLIEWQKREREQATVDKLLSALRSCKLNMVADSVEEEDRFCEGAVDRKGRGMRKMLGGTYHQVAGLFLSGVVMPKKSDFMKTK